MDWVRCVLLVVNGIELYYVEMIMINSKLYNGDSVVFSGGFDVVGLIGIFSILNYLYYWSFILWEYFIMVIMVFY